MPFFLVILAIVFLITAIRGTTTTLFGLIKADFSGSGNYLYWVISILIIGAIGYVKPLQKLSDAFLALVLIVMVIANKGFFAQFTEAIKNPQCVQAQSSDQQVASGATTTSASGANVLGNGVTQFNTSYGQGLGITNQNNPTSVGGVPNFGTSY